MSAPSPHSEARGLRRVPAPLAALLLAVLLLGTAWVMVNPVMQAPDEQVHVGYSQYLGETFALPGKRLDANPLPSEEFLALERSNGGRAASQDGIQMSWSVPLYQLWRAESDALTDEQRKDAGGRLNPATSNPPLYYLTTVPAYVAAGGSDFFGRLTAMRMVSVLWLLLTVTAAWLLAGELFGRRRLLQLGVAGAVGLAPMNQFVSSSVTPDAALFATWALVLWLGARMLNRGVTPGRAFALFLAFGAASVVKATSYALLPAVALVLVVATVRAVRRRRTDAASSGEAPSTVDERAPADETTAAPEPAPPAAAATTRPADVRRLALPFLTATLAVLATVGVWFVVSRSIGVAAFAQASDVAAAGNGAGGGFRGLVSYLWQFYLPGLPGMTPIVGQSALPVYDVLLKGAWAAFGWREVLFPGWVYALLGLITAAVGVLAAVGLWRDRRRVDWMIGLFFLLVAAGLLGGLHWTEFGKGGFGFIQGRYLLPLAPLAAAALVRAILWAPPRVRGPLIGGALGGLLVLDLFSLGLVLERFYA